MSLRLLIDIPSFTPVSRSDDSDPVFSVGEPYRHDLIPNFSETIIPLFGLAMSNILCDHTLRVSECILRQAEWNSMFLLIVPVFLLVPFKPNFVYKDSLSRR
jgi:hypothetical protein